jgi:hypothetical protein
MPVEHNSTAAYNKKSHSSGQKLRKYLSVVVR